MKRKKEDAAVTKQAVLDAALKVFNRKGYTQATLEAVAREAGVTRGAIYWHFNNKLEMFGAVLASLSEKAKSRIDTILNSGDNSLQKIRRLISEIFVMSLNKEELKIIEDIRIFKSEKRKELKDLYLKHKTDVKSMRDMIKEIIQKGIDSGEFDPRLDPNFSTWALISFLAGIQSTWLSDITDIYKPENAERLMDIFINGIIKK